MELRVSNWVAAGCQQVISPHRSPRYTLLKSRGPEATRQDSSVPMRTSLPSRRVTTSNAMTCARARFRHSDRALSVQFYLWFPRAGVEANANVHGAPEEQRQWVEEAISQCHCHSVGVLARIGQYGTCNIVSGVPASTAHCQATCTGWAHFDRTRVTHRTLWLYVVQPGSRCTPAVASTPSTHAL